MQLSVITVCFNSARTIGRTIESFCRQDHADKELIVVDGGSADSTLSVVRSFQDEPIRVISEPDRGIYDAMNKGLAAFSGEAVGFLNSDDRFKDERSLSHIAEGLEDSEITYGDLDFVDEAGIVVRRWRSDHYSPGCFSNGWMPAHPTFYVRRKVVDAVGPFDLAYRIAADYDFMLRAMELHDFRSRFVDRVLVEMGHGGASTAGLRSYLKSNVEALQARRRWLASGPVDKALIAKPLRKIGQFLGR